MNRRRLLAVAAALSTAAVGLVANGDGAFAALIPDGKENTNVIVQNDGTGPAVIVMDFYRPDGTLVPGATETFENVPVGGSKTFVQATNAGLETGFRGAGQISSDQDVNGLQVRDIENSSGLHSYSVHNALPSGAQKVALPFIANLNGNTFSTRFAIANAGQAVSCVKITYSYIDIVGSYTDNGPGGGGCGSGYPIPVGGQIAFAPTTVDGAMVMPAQTLGRVMGAIIEATGGGIVVGVDAYLKQLPGQVQPRKLASYDGFAVNDGAPATDDVGTNISIPLAIKLDGFYSQILVSNVTNQPAAVTITYRGNSGPYVVNLNIPANGAGTHSVYSDNIVPENFIGSATVTSTQNVAAVLFRSKMTAPGSFVDEDLYTAVSGVPADRAANSAKLPLVFRRIAAGPGQIGYNTWYSVAVMDGGSANLQITSVTDTTNTPGSCGAAAQYNSNKTINGSFVFYQNANSDNGFGANPTCFWGSVTITSDKPIIVIANVTSDLVPGDNDGLYNAFGD